MRDLKNYKVSAPAPVTLEGRFVTVEPYERGSHLEALWEALGGREGINALLRYFPGPDYADLADLAAARDAAALSGWLTHIFRDRGTGAVVGMASYMRADPANGVVEVGGVAHGPAMSRSPLSTEAHYLMARHVFEDLGYRRYEWKCHNENAASKRAAARYGFAFEGVFRQHMISKGENRDTAWFSIIDSEWPALARAFEAWLDPANFGADGRQIHSLEAIRAEQAGNANEAEGVAS